MKLKNKPFYKEGNIITSDTPFTLYQQVLFNRPNVIDEEFAYTIKFQFIDSTTAKLNKIIDLAKDTTTVKCIYGIFSIWNWSDENNKISGTIEILNWQKDRVILKENVIVDDYRRKEKIRFKGIRTFKTKEGW